MKTVEAFECIRQPWLARVTRLLARGEELRENLKVLLESLFHLLKQAIETGDPAWLDPLLDEWLASRTQSELDASESSLPPIFNQILMISFEIAYENLAPDEAMLLLDALLPLFGYASDYTAQKEISLYVEHMARELEKANLTLQGLDKSKSDFIAIAAHELKTPLTLIEGYAAMLRADLSLGERSNEPPESGESNSHIMVLLKGIDNGTRRLREIVDDMIDVSLIDNNLLSLNFQPFWLNRLLKVLQLEFEGTVKDRGQVLNIKVFPGSDEMTFGDDERLFQAFRNLFANAVKYTPDGGTITIDGRKLPGFIEVTITDTGIGIDPEDHTRIFEKFGRIGSVSLHSSGKTKFKGGGPGLGLPITKGIIEAHGGAIWVDSDGYDEVKCPGSTFHVLLPLRKTPPDTHVAKLFQSMTDPGPGTVEGEID